MEISNLVLTVVVALLGGGAFGAIVVKRMNKSVDAATVEKIKSEARETAVVAAQAAIAVLQSVLEEVRASDQSKSELLTKQTSDIAQLVSRVEHLEERERHMLVRASVHEAWDQMAFQFILQHQPDYQPPPPLAIDRNKEEGK